MFGITLQMERHTPQRSYLKSKAVTVGSLWANWRRRWPGGRSGYRFLLPRKRAFGHSQISQSNSKSPRNGSSDGVRKTTASCTAYRVSWRYTSPTTFEDTANRVKLLRNRPDWKLLRDLLPPVQASPSRPTIPHLSGADLYEAALLRLPDDQFDAAVVLPGMEGPIATGCSIIDELENAFWSDDPSLVTWTPGNGGEFG